MSLGFKWFRGGVYRLIFETKLKPFPIMTVFGEGDGENYERTQKKG